MKKEKIQELISQMTLEEKAGMCSGADPDKLRSSYSVTVHVS